MLLPATIALWAAIIIRVYGTLHTGAGTPGFSPGGDTDQSAEINDRDTFSIANNYRDPFSEKQVVRTTLPGTDKKEAAGVKQQVQKKESTWPGIQYAGMIKNQKSNRQLVMLQINGNLKTMKSGDVSDEVQVCRVFKDSVELMYGKEKRFFKK